MHWPSLVESILAVAAIAALLPLFDRVAVNETGRDRRFADTAVRVNGLPERVLPTLCASEGARAEPQIRDRLCRGIEIPAVTAPAHATMPTVLRDAYAQVTRAFRQPLAEAELRRAELRLQQREGLGDLLALGDAIDAVDADLRPYMERYRLDSGDGRPLPLVCAFELVNDSVARAKATAAADSDTAAANAVLLLGAALDGHGSTQALSTTALLPGASRANARGCAGLALTDALAGAAALMADARESRVRAAKNDAMRALLRTAGWQWAGWMLAGLLLIKLSRRPHFAFAGTAIALAIWALAAFIGRVPWPLGGDRAFEPAREARTMLDGMPAPFVLALLAAAAVAALGAATLDRRLPARPQTLASRIGYPGLVVALGLGWLLLLDQSSNGTLSNRYLALYHQGHLWLGMLALTVVAFLRRPFGLAFAWTFALLDALATRLRRRLGSPVMVTTVVVAMLAAVAAVGAALPSRPQITSELGRVWLIGGASWFFFLRGEPLAARLARSGTSIGSLVRYSWPLVCIALVAARRAARHPRQGTSAHRVLCGGRLRRGVGCHVVASAQRCASCGRRTCDGGIRCVERRRDTRAL